MTERSEEIIQKLDEMKSDFMEILAKHNVFFENNRDMCFAVYSALHVALADNAKEKRNLDMTPALGDPTFAAEMALDAIKGQALEMALGEKRLDVFFAVLKTDIGKFLDILHKCTFVKNNSTMNRDVLEQVLVALVEANKKTSTQKADEAHGKAVNDVVMALMDILEATKATVANELRKRGMWDEEKNSPILEKPTLN